MLICLSLRRESPRSHPSPAARKNHPLKIARRTRHLLFFTSLAPDLHYWPAINANHILPSTSRGPSRRPRTHSPTTPFNPPPTGLASPPPIRSMRRHSGSPRHAVPVITNNHHSNSASRLAPRRRVPLQRPEQLAEEPLRLPPQASAGHAAERAGGFKREPTRAANNSEGNNNASCNMNTPIIK